MESHSIIVNIAIYLLRALVFAPLAGVFCGFIVASVGFNISGSIFDPSFIFSYAIVYGVPTGLLFGILVFWSLRNQSLFDIGLFLVGGTLLFGLPFALIPNIGVTLSWFGGIVGFWIGFVCLKTSIHSYVINSIEKIGK